MSVKAWMRILSGREDLWDRHPCDVVRLFGGRHTSNLKRAQELLRRNQIAEEWVAQGAFLATESRA